MVRVDSTPRAPSSAYYGPPGATDMTLRRVSAVGLAILLYSAAIPFTPVTWFFPAEGAFFLDMACAGIILVCACYFQWRISGLTAALALSIPGAGGQSIRNGRMERNGDMVFLWQTSNYWPFAICEAVLLALAEFGPSEMLRRSLVVGVIAGLWVLGWHATPGETKRWAWEHIKNMWFWMILSELLSVGRPSMNRRRRNF